MLNKDHTQNMASVLLCNAIEHVQAAWTKTKHCSSIVRRVCVAGIA
jgi:hypothetical protein